MPLGYNCIGSGRNTPLFYAIQNDNDVVGAEITKFLVSQGADVNAKDRHDYTTLHYASSSDIQRECRNSQSVVQAPEVKQQDPPIAVKGYNEGYNYGCDNGIEVGRGERDYEIARKMKEQGEPTSKIAKITGLSVSEIDRMG